MLEQLVQGHNAEGIGKRYGGKGELLTLKLALTNMAHECLADLSENVRRRDQRRCHFKVGPCLFASRLLSEPFHDDARIDHNGQSPSRIRRMTSVLSEVCPGGVSDLE